MAYSVQKEVYSSDKTLSNVVLQNLKFPDSPLDSLQAKDFIRELLVKETENRLQSEKGSTEIKRYQFFERLNWALIRCAIPPKLLDFNEFDGEPEAQVHLEATIIGIKLFRFNIDWNHVALIERRDDYVDEEEGNTKNEEKKIVGVR
ncbi:hypothetical protein F2Q70_00017074 [Brassica cretica]|uniref:non-specific serine/threonine protein kinase n=1 Tax=Brassica cretica TaxID=69181 RepID=A0A3N6TK17_BRACR|nr:hypothetical protein F2Q70_00017074 [Brassica cretica]KAF2597643.1 hypothetical protein F2Q68_00010025 [Brassica cretica]